MGEVNPYAPPQVDSRPSEAADVAPTIVLAFEADEAEFLRIQMELLGQRLKWQIYRAALMFAAMPICLVLAAGITLLLSALGLRIDTILLAIAVVAVAPLFFVTNLANRYLLFPRQLKEAAGLMESWRKTSCLSFGRWALLVGSDDLVIRDDAGTKFRLPLRSLRVQRLFGYRNVSGFALLNERSEIVVIPTSATCSVPWPEFDRILQARCGN
jgi:hypothetical protein